MEANKNKLSRIFGYILRRVMFSLETLPFTRPTDTYRQCKCMQSKLCYQCTIHNSTGVWRYFFFSLQTNSTGERKRWRVEKKTTYKYTIASGNNSIRMKIEYLVWYFFQFFFTSWHQIDSFKYTATVAVPFFYHISNFSF